MPMPQAVRDLPLRAGPTDLHAKAIYMRLPRLVAHNSRGRAQARCASATRTFGPRRSKSFIRRTPERRIYSRFLCDAAVDLGFSKATACASNNIPIPPTIVLFASSSSRQAEAYHEQSRNDVVKVTPILALASSHGGHEQLQAERQVKDLKGRATSAIAQAAMVMIMAPAR